MKHFLNSLDKQTLAIALLILFAAIYFYPVISYDWVGLDDVDLILNNPYIRDNRLFDLISSVQISHFHPAVNLWLWAFYKAMGLAGIKLSCIILHLANVYLFVFLLQRYFAVGLPLATAAAFLWSIHPMSAEVLYWATGPKELLGTFGALASLHFFYQRQQSKTVSALWMAAAALAILSKSTWVILFPIYLFLAIPLWHHAYARRRSLLVGLSFIAGMALISAFMTILGHQTLQIRSDFYQTLMALFSQEQTGTSSASLTQIFTSLAFYLGRWSLPIDLTPFFHSDHTSLQWTDVSMSVIFLTLGIWNWHKKILSWNIFLLAFVPLLPVLGLIPFGYKQAQACRYVYFSMPFFMIIVLGLIPRRWLWPLVVLISAALFMAGINYRSIYTNKETFYRHMLKLQPNSSVALNGLGTWHAQQGDMAQAYTHLQQALVTDANYLQANFNLGIVLLKQKRCPEAIQYLQHALKLNSTLKETQRALQYCREQIAPKN